MSDIKTGNKGFVNPIDGKVYHIDQVPVGEDGVNVPENLKPIDPGNIKIDSTVKDIGKKTRITLGTYLSEMSKGNVGSTGVSNKYSLDPPTDATQTTKLVDNNGYPSPISPSENSEQFSKDLPSSFSNEFSKLQQGGEKLKKGLSPVNAPDGHALLPNAKKNNSPIPGYTSSVVSNNTFNSDANVFLEKEIDVTSPPGTFEPEINDIAIDEAKGTYTGAKKDPLTLKESRQKAVDVTAKNKFSLDENSANSQLGSTVDSVTGIPSPLSDQTNLKSYVGRDQIKPESTDASLVGTGFQKGKNVNAEYDGHNLLKTVNGNSNATSNNVAKKSSGVTFGNQTASDDEFGTPVNGGANFPSDHPLNSYRTNNSSVLSVGNNRWSPKVLTDNNFNPSLNVAGFDQPISHMKMAKVGSALLQRASFEIPAVSADKFDPTGNLAEIGAIVPSFAQLGFTKVNNQLLSAKDVLEAIVDAPDLDTESLTSIAPLDGQSWGNMTSPVEPFDDPNSVGHSIAMLALVNAITLVLDFYASNSTNERKLKTDRGQYAKGKNIFSRPESGANLFNQFYSPAELTGIYQTRNNLKLAISAGSKAFFFGAGNLNIDNESVLVGTLGIGLDSLIGDNSLVGANLTVARNIIRSGLVLVQQLDAVVKSFRTSATGGLKSLRGVLRIIRNSKFIGALNVFAQIGDNILDMRRGPTRTSPDGKDESIGSMDLIDPNIIVNDKGTLKINGLKQSVTKNRLTYGDKYDPTLSWSTARAPALYLTNPNVSTLAQQDSEGILGSFKGHLTLNNASKGGTPHAIFNSEGQNGRISGDEREKIERVLDAEYVPFSFHDIRTNEVVSFHAFLSSLNDDYSVAYDTSEGIGRTEPVKIYKSTSRKIGMSFFIASTSEEDFDHMWFKINKLTTMIYPQYTAGRDMLPGNYQFKAPFSQLQGASPLIRIRLGDLFRSNYSRFALARLFGAADGNMKIPASGSIGSSESTVQVLFNEIVEKRKKRAEELKKQFQADVDKRFIRKELDKNSIKKYFVDQIKRSEHGFVAVTIPESDTYLDSDILYIDFNYLSAISEIISAKIIGIAINDENGLANEYIVQIDYKKISYSTKNPPNSSPRERKVSVLISILPNALDLLNDIYVKQVESQLAKEGYAPLDEQFAALTQFMSPENNAIVKSFESAAGRGLAGVIESMNFDWYDRVTWSTDFGRVAPKLCKVTISFSPIHDIAPGLDHRGYNRAPIYPVGAGMAPSRIAKK